MFDKTSSDIGSMYVTKAKQKGSSQESRLLKLTRMKLREELKDTLVERMKSRYGAAGAKARLPDEGSVSSGFIREEVEKFMGSSLSETNLTRLERRMRCAATEHCAAGSIGAPSVSSYSYGDGIAGIDASKAAGGRRRQLPAPKRAENLTLRRSLSVGAVLPGGDEWSFSPCRKQRRAVVVAA
eukprot:TRINITY_DN73028_c0_g1_i1.p1 TRINITY_DN73028_c0_g1~~TRINITY_DN73028_c0_g1_i1.p1  ORF type:complete len:183 (+),score=61.44 TRINITY_DN73028_c0_g1_i1:137-685(+)